jgi:hypothetical protein
MPAAEFPEALAFNKVSEILKWDEDVLVQFGRSSGPELKDARELVFTGQVYLYSERPVPEAIKTRLIDEASGVGLRLTFRSVEYMNERNKLERTRAFISHDSRDNASVAEPIAYNSKS